MQNAQAAIDQSSRDTAASVPSQQPQPLVAPVSPTRCPRCNAELRRQATFCPQCGFSLTNKPQNNPGTTPPPAPITPTFTAQNSINPTQENNRALPGGSAEPTIAVRPKLPVTTPDSTGTPQQGSTVSMPPTPGQNIIRTQSKPSTQDRIFSPATPQVPPKSFIHTSAPTLVQDTPITQGPFTASTTKPANSAVSSETRKILLYMVIVFIVVLLIVVFIVLKIFGYQSSGSTIDQHYAYLTQVCKYEQNISLCVTSTTPHPHTGLWTRRTGVPSTISISERMVGSRIRHTPNDHGDWLA